MNATATLNVPAPPGGAVVALASATTAANVAHVPPSVTVPAGALAAQFAIPTSGTLVTAITVQVTALYGGSSAAASFTINPFRVFVPPTGIDNTHIITQQVNPTLLTHQAVETPQAPEAAPSQPPREAPPQPPEAAPQQARPETSSSSTSQPETKPKQPPHRRRKRR